VLTSVVEVDESPMPSPRTHTIRLKGPWTVTFHRAGEATTGSGEQQTVQLPAEWRSLFGDAAGRAAFERRFNRPTGLTSGHRVRIEFRGVPGPASVRLNGELVTDVRSGDELTAVDVTDQLHAHNCLRVEIEFDPQAVPGCAGGLWQPVVVAIEEPPESVT
jgi:beta-galactosidase/beta-glucuronidase